MRLVDLSGEIYDTQKAHYEVSIKDHLRHEDTAPNLEEPCRGFATKALNFCDHTGTHVDAPLHFYPDGKSIAEIPVEAFCGPAVVADFSDQGPRGGDLPVQPFRDNLRDRQVSFEDGDVVLFQLNTPAGEPVYGGISGELAEFLLDHRVKLVGTDQGSIDWSENRGRPAHVTLLRHDVPIVEGLRNLSQVAGERSLFMGLPLKLREGTGSPIRAVAVLDVL